MLLERYRSIIERGGGSTRTVDRLLGMLRRAHVCRWDEIFARLHKEGCKLPIEFERDYVALCLEALAEETSAREERALLLHYAQDRALWCASVSTAGGEGIARSRHVNELREKLENLAG